MSEEQATRDDVLALHRRVVRLNREHERAVVSEAEAAHIGKAARAMHEAAIERALGMRVLTLSPQTFEFAPRKRTPMWMDVV